jgi:hypothetical protein
LCWRRAPPLLLLSGLNPDALPRSFLVSGDAEGDGIIRMTPQHNRMVQTLDAATGAPLGDEPGVSYL